MTITVRRANVILDVPDYQQDEYLAKGFDVIDASGKVLVKATPNDLNSLKKAYAEVLSEVEKLRKENSELKARLASKSNEVEEVVEEQEETFTPINKRNSKKTK